MKRPMFVIGFVYILALLILQGNVPEKNLIFAPIISALICILLISIPITRKNKTIIISAVTITFAAIVSFVNFKINIETTRKYNEREEIISGIIDDLPYEKNGTLHYKIKVDYVTNEEVAPFKVMLSSSAPLECDFGDRLYCVAHFYIPQSSYFFDSKQYYHSQGIYINAYVKNPDQNYVKKNPENSLRHQIIKLRTKLLDAPKNFLDEKIVNIQNGIFLGEQNNIENLQKINLLKNFRNRFLSAFCDLFAARRQWVVLPGCSFGRLLSSPPGGLFDLPVGMLLQKLLPTLGTAFRNRFLAPSEPFHPFFAQRGIQRTRRGEIVAQGYRHAVRGVEPPRRAVEGQQPADDPRHLLLRGRSAPRDRLLDPHRGILEDRQAAAQCRGHRNALCASQFQHRLHVLPEEGRFQSHLPRPVLVDQRPDPLEDVAQLGVGVCELVQVDVAQHHRTHRASLDLQHAVTHVVRAGVDAHDAVFLLCFHSVAQPCLSSPEVRI